MNLCYLINKRQNPRYILGSYYKLLRITSVLFYSFFQFLCCKYGLKIVIAEYVLNTIKTKEEKISIISSTNNNYKTNNIIYHKSQCNKMAAIGKGNLLILVTNSTNQCELKA